MNVKQESLANAEVSARQPSGETPSNINVIVYYTSLFVEK